MFSCVVGWKLKEHELVAGGGGAVVEFDSEAFREWSEDRLDVLAELVDKVRAIIKTHNEEKVETEKN